MLSVCYINEKTIVHPGWEEGRAGARPGDASLNTEPKGISLIQSADVYDGLTAVIVDDKPLNKYLDLPEELLNQPNGQVTRR